MDYFRKKQKRYTFSLIIICVIVVTICIYGYGQKRRMYNDLNFRLSSDKDIKSITGEFISSELFFSESDCLYIGSCSTSTHYYKVIGKKRCIGVEVVLYENFPKYYVQNVTPMGRWVTSYIGGKLIMDNQWQFIECSSLNFNKSAEQRH